MARKVIEVEGDIGDEIARLAALRGQTEREIVDRALKSYVRDASPVITDPEERARILDAGAGMWKDRNDLPDFAALRGEWDERLERFFGHG
jgi:hypothetical protein